MACPLCSCLVIDYSKVQDDQQIALPFEIEERYPGLFKLTKNADGGCDFCGLLVQLLNEYFGITESSLARPIDLQLRNANFCLESYEKTYDEESLYAIRKRNSVTQLLLELAYGSGQESRTKTLTFALYSDNGGESRICKRCACGRVTADCRRRPVRPGTVPNAKTPASTC